MIFRCVVSFEKTKLKFRIYRCHPVYGEFFKKYLEEGGVVCIFFLSFFLLIGAKLIFFLSNIDSPYHRCGELTTLRISDAGSRRLRFLSACCGKGDQNESTIDIEAYYRNKTKMFWFGPLTIGTKAERFNLFQNYLKSNWNVLAFF